MFIFETHQSANPRFMINFPTKRHWREPSYIEDIESGLIALVKAIQSLGIKSIAIPPLGAGLGGPDWAVVREKTEAATQSLIGVDILLYEPVGAPENSKIAKQKRS